MSEKWSSYVVVATLLVWVAEESMDEQYNEEDIHSKRGLLWRLDIDNWDKSVFHQWAISRCNPLELDEDKDKIPWKIWLQGRILILSVGMKFSWQTEQRDSYFSGSALQMTNTILMYTLCCRFWFWCDLRLSFDYGGLCFLCISPSTTGQWTWGWWCPYTTHDLLFDEIYDHHHGRHTGEIRVSQLHYENEYIEKNVPSPRESKVAVVSFRWINDTSSDPSW